MTQRFSEATMENVVKLAFIIQRYGKDLSGGAEEHARRLAEHLVGRADIEILTTCATSYDTWENIFKPGSESVNGVTVRRFATDFRKEKESFDLMTESLLSRPHSYLEELEWLVHQGPYSEGLFHYLRQHHQEYDWLIFYTYLYVTTVFGLAIAPERSLLISTAHDEPVSRFSIFRSVFHLPRAIYYLAEEERSFVHETFHNRYKPSTLLGMGLDQWESVEADSFVKKYGIRTPYLLYVGRVDKGKGCGELVSWFTRFLNDQGNPDISLVLVGARHMEEVRHPRIIMTGYVSDHEKNAALSAAKAVVSPSRFESLSILLLEAFNAARPLLANGRSLVVKGHCLRSGGGLVYETYDDFKQQLARLIRDEELCRSIGEKGRAYIETDFRWSGVIERFTSLISSLEPPPKLPQS